MARYKYLSLFLISFIFITRSAGTGKFSIQHDPFFFFLLSPGQVIWQRLGNPFLLHNSRNCCDFHSTVRIPGCTYTICSYGQNQTSCTILCRSPFYPVVSSIILSLLLSFITWLIISFLSPHNRDLLFCCILSVFALR